MSNRASQNRMPDEGTWEKCIGDALLFRYLQGELTKSEAVPVERHINFCQTCLETIAFYAKDFGAPASEAEKKEIARLITLTPEEQVANIISYANKLCQPTRDNILKSRETGPEQEAMLPPRAGIWQALQRWFESPKLTPRYAFAFVALLTVLTGSYLGIRFFNTSYRVAQAEKLLRENYEINIVDAARLSGGYESSGIGTLMAGGQTAPVELPYLKHAATLLKEALASGSTSPKAKQLLIQLLIIEKNYPQADSLLKQLKPESLQSAALLNDLGVLYFEQGALDTANHHFEAATKASPRLLEARYNLALTKTKLGATAEAMAILDEYIKLETNEDWRHAAIAFRGRLLQQRDERRN